MIATVRRYRRGFALPREHAEADVMGAPPALAVSAGHDDVGRAENPGARADARQRLPSPAARHATADERRNAQSECPAHAGTAPRPPATSLRQRSAPAILGTR